MDLVLLELEGQHNEFIGDRGGVGDESRGGERVVAPAHPPSTHHPLHHVATTNHH